MPRVGEDRSYLSAIRLRAETALELDEQLALMQTDEARDALRAFLKDRT